MRIALIDVETTGIDPSLDVPIEVSIIFLEDDCVVGHWDSLIHPGERPISPVASACHHITHRTYEAEDYVHQMSVDFWSAVLDGCDYLVAHNAVFDRQYVPSPIPWICTYKCSRHLWPDAPKFSLQALRYWMDLAQGLQGSAHRARYDTLCMLDLWREMRKLRSTEELACMSNTPLLLPTVTFGKHKGTPWKDVPLDYLHWILRQEFDEDVMFTARHHLAQA